MKGVLGELDPVTHEPIWLMRARAMNVLGNWHNKPRHMKRPYKYGGCPRCGFPLIKKRGASTEYLKCKSCGYSARWDSV